MDDQKGNYILQAEATIPTPYGTWMMSAYAEDDANYSPHIVLSPVAPDAPDLGKAPLVRIHSECITGDLFGSRRCDCGEQLQESFRKIQKEGGFILYLRQEGRGIGIIEKLKAYNLQDQGRDTIKANVELGHPIDGRDYDVAVQLLHDQGVHHLRLLTNNPEKVAALSSSSIHITERVSLIIPANQDNEDYLRTKQEFMGHFL